MTYTVTTLLVLSALGGFAGWVYFQRSRFLAERAEQVLAEEERQGVVLQPVWRIRPFCGDCGKEVKPNRSGLCLNCYLPYQKTWLSENVPTAS